MKFDDLNQKMRVFEELNDQFVLPNIFVVARLDGRSFTRLTKEVHKFEAPYDIKFRDYMIETVKHLMSCGFRIIYGYMQSDEISLLFHPDEDSFQRKIRKLNSILAGEASAKLSLLLGDIATFDCRISQLPNIELVVDYFRWRNEDAHRNALNSHCYWLLRKKGEKTTAAANFLNKKSVEKIFQGGLKMKKKMRLIFIPILIIMLLSSAFSQERAVQPVELKKISDNLYEILGGRGARGGCYIGDNAVLVIDSKMNQESIDQTIAEIKKLTDKPIKYLVNTHSDGDHITGNQFFPATVTFIAHENCRKEFFHPRRDGTPSDWNNTELASFIPSITFKEKMDIYLGSKKVELCHFGIGHTTGDAVVYFPEEKIAFIGDQVFLTRPQLIHSYKGGNSFGHVKNLSKMLVTIDAEYFCSGHDEMADRQAIKQHIEQMKNRQDKIRQLIDQGLSLEAIKSEFDENEARLVESIFNEIKQGA